MRIMIAKNHRAIALVLGIFLLGGIIIINTINANPVRIELPSNYFQTNMSGAVTDSYADLDAANENYSIYLLAVLLDENNTKLGYVGITGGIQRQSDGRYYVYGSASAETYGDIEGVAFAKGQLPGREEVVDGPHWNRYASAWDAYHSDVFPSGSGSGKAELTVNDVTIWISVTGTI